MTATPKTPVDLLSLAPVAANLDTNLQRIRDVSPRKIRLQIAHELNRPEGYGTVEERIQRVLALAVRNVELHGWTPTITDDHCRMRLSGGALSLDLGLSTEIKRFIEGAH